MPYLSIGHKSKVSTNSLNDGLAQKGKSSGSSSVIGLAL